MRALLPLSALVLSCSSTVVGSDGGAQDDAAVTGHVVAIAGAGANTCALRDDGRVRCWGHYSVPGTLPAAQWVTEVQGLSDARQIAVSPNVPALGYAARASGEVARWQRVENHMLLTPLATPAGVTTPQRQVAAGAAHACVLDDAGDVRCWGDNRMGQLGDGTFTARDAPTRVQGLAAAAEIAAAEADTCARLRDGTVWCWGRNYAGALGDGRARHGCPIDGSDEDCSAVPVRVSGITAATHISVGLNGACAVERGRALCWGWNSDRRLGDGTEVDRSTPALVALSPGPEVTRVFSGYLDGCAVRADGSLWCWGIDFSDESDGGQLPRHDPTRVPGLSRVRDVTGGWDHRCALDLGGSVWCWGGNGFGQLGRDTPARSGPLRVEGL